MSLVYLTSFLIIVSPGPSSFTIVSTSMMTGRTSGFLVAAGVVSGALTWGTLAAIGVSALLSAFPGAVTALQIFGGLYLAFLSLSSAIRIIKPPEFMIATSKIKTRLYYLKGYAVHMSNPEAMLGWVAIISLGLTQSAPTFAPIYIVTGCVLIGALVYNSYAFLFSDDRIALFYQRCRPIIDAIFAILFAFASFKLFTAAV